VAGHRPAGDHPLPGSGMALRAAGFRDGVQADDPGAALVRFESAVLYHCVYVHIREPRQDSHQRDSSDALLLWRDDALGLLHLLPQQRGGHVYGELGAFQQGVLSPSHGADLEGVLESFFRGDSAGDAHCLLYLLRGHRGHSAAHLGGLCHTPHFPPARGSRDGLRHGGVGAHHQVPGLAAAHRLRHRAVDVRDAHCVSANPGTGEVPLDYAGQSGDGAHRDLQGGCLWGGRGRPGAAGHKRGGDLRIRVFGTHTLQS